VAPAGGAAGSALHPKIAELKQACLATLELTVDRHEPGRGRAPYRVRCRDETGFIELVFFNVRGPIC